MSTKVTERRRDNGSRFEGRSLADQIAREVAGMMLAQAFVTTRSAGFKLQVAKHDGVPRTGYVDEGKRDDRIMVNVANGFVRAGWVG